MSDAWKDRQGDHDRCDQREGLGVREGLEQLSIYDATMEVGGAVLTAPPTSMVAS